MIGLEINPFARRPQTESLSDLIKRATDLYNKYGEGMIYALPEVTYEIEEDDKGTIVAESKPAKLIASSKKQRR
jgi:hypothetical protein